jgi:hypothetical protein
MTKPKKRSVGVVELLTENVVVRLTETMRDEVWEAAAEQRIRPTDWLRDAVREKLNGGAK